VTKTGMASYASSAPSADVAVFRAESQVGRLVASISYENPGEHAIVYLYDPCLPREPNPEAAPMGATVPCSERLFAGGRGASGKLMPLVARLGTDLNRRPCDTRRDALASMPAKSAAEVALKIRIAIERMRRRTKRARA
jgi:hypothetical protein